MRSTLLSLIASLFVASLPLVLAGKGGPTFCQSVDKLKVTSPLTFIRPVPSVNLKWNPKICLCQSEGELTDSTVNQLEAKVKQEGSSKLAKKLGLDTLPDDWEELFVRQAVIDAAQEFLDQYKSCPRGCDYPKRAIPNSCQDCGYDCPKGQQKCKNKCKDDNKPCESKTPKPPKTTSSDGYPSYPTEYRKRDANILEPAFLMVSEVPVPSDRQVAPDWNGEPFTLKAPTPTELHEESTEDDNVAKGAFVFYPTPATTFAVSDIPEPTMIQQYYRSTNNNKCEPGWIPCAVLRKGKADWECTDVQNTLDSCGGCIYPILPGPVGTSCSEETGANEVACVQGHCKVKSCQRGFAHNGTACNPASRKRYSLE
ncbi:hypothetical protein QFC19_004967 [Naganishia cerealis]|uniref:Uncharacterized protein n=1 Tax=Naganishia cerealis TaxID=610337 RepID=A0ACC2VRH5_9TREE|nr:hypothetical protein QFC19_004967 [Naganishia cerealis]